jgi:hypothetical protein
VSGPSCLAFLDESMKYRMRATLWTRPKTQSIKDSTMRRRWLTVSTLLTVVALASTACVGPLPDVPGTGVWGTSGREPGGLTTPTPQVPTAQPDIMPTVQPGVYSNSPPPGMPSSSTQSPASTSPQPGMPSSSTPSPAAQGQSSPTPKQGPITNYGPGGMGAPPGSPPAPPY